MARHNYWLLLLLVLCSVIGMAPQVAAGDFTCDVSFNGGGCPDEKDCAVTCSHCYLNWGKVVSFCVQDFGVYWRCVCGFKNGAPCPPFDGCRPPRPPAMNNTNDAVNGTRPPAMINTSDAVNGTSMKFLTIISIIQLIIFMIEFSV